MFRALKFRNFRIFFAGQAVSMIGTAVQSTALAWTTYRLTDSALLLGIVAALGTLPTLLISPLSGVMADRCNLRRMLITTQSLMLIHAVVLTLLSALGVLNFWHIAGLALFVGVIQTFDLSARQVLLLSMVEGKDGLSSGIALSSLMVNSSRFVGPLISAGFLANASETACFALNALSFIPVLISIHLLRIVPPASKGAHLRNIRGDLKEGADYLRRDHNALQVVLMSSVCAVCIAPAVPMLPAVSRELLGAGPSEFGALMGACGLGAMIALVMLSRIPASRIRQRIIAFSLIQTGLLIGLALSSWAPLSILITLAMGFSQVFTAAGAAFFLQYHSPELIRGRVMGIFTMATVGASTFGGPLIGAAAGFIGLSAALIVASATAILCMGMILLMRIRGRRNAELRPAGQRCGRESAATAAQIPQ